MESKNFALGDVLSVTTRKILSPTGFTGCLRLLQYMYHDREFPMDILDDVGTVCAVDILTCHPQFEDVHPRNANSPSEMLAWLEIQKGLYGDSVAVTRLPDVSVRILDNESKKHPNALIVVRDGVPSGKNRQVEQTEGAVEPPASSL